MHIDHFTYPERAERYLAGALSAGTLVLFLGAGMSSGAGLPNWPVLVRRMRGEVGLPTDDIEDPADALQRAADDVRRALDGDEQRFAEVVTKCLYEGVDLEESLVCDNLLVALGALMMGSRRGSVRRVVTFNFDSVLEYYLSVSGYVPLVVVKPPVDEGTEDVRVYHPHGFLPHPDLDIASSESVILGLKAINERLGSPHDEWFTTVRQVLLTGVGLFVGLSEHSFRDRALAPLLADVAKNVKNRRPTGFWILAEKRDKMKSLQEEFLEYNIVPLQLDGYQLVPKFLLRVCQLAAEKIRVSK